MVELYTFVLKVEQIKAPAVLDAIKIANCFVKKNKITNCTIFEDTNIPADFPTYCELCWKWMLICTYGTRAKRST